MRLSVSWGSSGFTRLDRYAVDIGSASPNPRTGNISPVWQFLYKFQDATMNLVPIADRYTHKIQEGALSILDCLAAIAEPVPSTNQVIVAKMTSKRDFP